VNFARIIQNSSNIATDIIITYSTRSSSSCTSPTINGISDHDAQFLTVNNITTKVNLMPLKYRTTKINNETTAQFQHLLKNNET
jgi:hypothetical protein